MNNVVITAGLKAMMTHTVPISSQLRAKEAKKTGNVKN